ncbi:MAG: hypothetical protein JWN75_1237 [Candidatus Saccharibacteria bacterium]|nr:hypothetical protein [Candidatus Saccharibacteria bacterium]
MIQASPEDIKRFLSFVEKLPNGCHYWTGGRSRGKGNKKWYGSFWLAGKDGKKGKTVRAHRFACEVLGGRECPPEHHRDHTCEFSMCVNEAHIEVVTHAVNQERKVARRRARINPHEGVGGAYRNGE